MILLCTAIALHLMHASGWVHHDISIGNILVDESGHGRLADMEYSKKMGTGQELRIVSGTIVWRGFRIF